VTIRLDRDLLEAARSRSAAENRTLTNFVETVVPRQMTTTDTPGPDSARDAPRDRVAATVEDQ